MAQESPHSPGRKHRVVHWKPGNENIEQRAGWRFGRILLWSVGGLVGLFILAAVAIRGVKLIVGPETFARWTAPAAATVDPGTSRDPTAGFVSRSKAELARETVQRGLGEIRRLPQDHPAQLQRLIMIERAFMAAETLHNAREFDRAWEQFANIEREIEAYARAAELRQEVQQAYDRVLVRIRDLGAARSLAQDRLDQAFAEAGIGRQFFHDGDFLAAKQRFDTAFTSLDEAERILRDHLETQMLLGGQALAEGDGEAAAAAFRAVLEKSPGDESAVRGLQRSGSIAQVHRLLQSAAATEEAGNYDEAATLYRQAFALDAFSATAQQGAARAARLALDTKFDAALALAEAAAEKRDWPAAIAGYEAALEVYPDREKVTAALKDARERSHREAVQAAFARAQDFEFRNLWQEAREAYHATIQLDPNNAEAKEAYARAGRVIRALVQYNRQIEAARDRAGRAQFQAAIAAFNEAMSVKPDYVEITPDLLELRDLLAMQNVPVNVTFISDNRTWVSVSNYRLLGRIDSMTVPILPGDYEIVGRRRGYQDVYLILQVRNGVPPPTVRVVCTDRARI
jgi:tetratricopeptide (TPR) repeat protein